MTIGIGLLGLGTVGAGVAAILATPQGRHPLVADLELKRVAVRDLARPRPVAIAEELLCTDPQAVAADTRLALVIAAMGALAEKHFAGSEAALALCDKDPVRPAVIMMRIYRQHLDRLRDNQWRPVPPLKGLARLKSNAFKLWTAIHVGLF